MTGMSKICLVLSETGLGSVEPPLLISFTIHPIYNFWDLFAAQPPIAYRIFLLFKKVETCAWLLASGPILMDLVFFRGLCQQIGLSFADFLWALGAVCPGVRFEFIWSSSMFSSYPVHHTLGCFLFASFALSLATQGRLFLARKPVATGKGVVLLFDVSQHHIVNTRQLTRAFFDVLLALSHTKFS